MEITDAVAKVNSTVNGVLDIFNKRWFIALLLWAVLATQLAAMWNGAPEPGGVARSAR